ncbi:MAG TPA: OB-fold domain-containing protein, partial [Burkholderiaceae bacterium]
RGTLVSWVRFHRAYWDGFRGEVPYDVCLVRLEEGPLFVANFFGATPEGLRQGMPLRVAFDDVTEAITLPRFVAARGETP